VRVYVWVWVWVCVGVGVGVGRCVWVWVGGSKFACRTCIGVWNDPACCNDLSNKAHTRTQMYTQHQKTTPI